MCMSITVSIALKPLECDDKTEVIFSVAMSILCFVHTIRLYYFLQNEDEIRRLICSLGFHSINDYQEFNRVNNKIKGFMKFATLYLFTCISGTLFVIVTALPLFSNEKKLPFNLYVPFDWKRNEITYWIAFLYIAYAMIFNGFYTLFNSVIWYLMMSCGLKYQTLSKEISDISVNDKKTLKKLNNSVAQEKDFFLLELIVLVKKHQDLYKYQLFL